MRGIGWWTWLGAALVVGGAASALGGTRIGLVYVTPVAWTGIILVVDGLLERRNQSWLRRRPWALLLMAVISIPSWLLFEWYDRPRFWLDGGPELWWHYHGLPPWPERALGYGWSFATITPAVLLIAHLIAPGVRHLVGRGRGGRIPAEVVWGLGAVGLMLASVPLLWPSAHFAADVWIAWILLLEPVNRRLRRPSVLGDLESGERGRGVALLASGLIAGVLWESINWLAGARWTYTVPFAGDVKMFEMPVLGYLGFAPFVLECFAIWSLLGGWTVAKDRLDWTEEV